MSIFSDPVLTGIAKASASGPIASFSDGAKGLSLRSLLVNIDPVQDLHGYDSPWPAGGGANQFDPFAWVALGLNSNFYSVGSDETITVLKNDGSSIGTRMIDIEPNVQYSFLSSFSNSVKIFSSDSVTIIQQQSGTFTSPVNGKIAIKFYANSYPTAGKFILVKGNTVPATWTPYSNICPISGWDGMTVYHSGADTSDPTTYPISLQSAGMVYGGTLDVLTGKLRGEYASGDMAPLSWTYDGQRWQVGNVPNLKNFPTRSADILFEKYGSSTSASSATENVGFTVGRAIYIYTSDSVNSPTGQFVYPLATQITIQLTPTEITTLLGQNNIWADTGDVDVEYLKQSLTYIGSYIH